MRLRRTMYLDSLAIIIAFARILSASFLNQIPFPAPPPNGDIHLAINPTCGQLSGDTADINAGIDKHSIKTIISYTDGGKSDGSPLDPPILVFPNPLAGGRSTNGLTWVENVANDLNATIKDYAQAGACIDLKLWPSNPRKIDFLGQMKTFLGQNNALDPNTTLYSIFFGINDYLASLIDGDHLTEAAQVLLDQIKILASPPTNARKFMVLDVYGRGTTIPSGETFKQIIYSGLSSFRVNGIQIINDDKHQPQRVTLDISYINFANIWKGVLGPNPGFEKFGYVSEDACTKCTAELGCTTIGMCDDPEHYFYWIPGHPSKETMRIMADYVREVWDQCGV
ncbi:hypothetical protein AGABI2DRAFT_115896 [Agaricus bisporus var. bisporus H97]|uniref:hypothetical protein n=1 Tax=Agaricus bisporus var. bisporus (strain H97 / ATCC MYA-4626 / FGSC 10389) TaxID=936046 RepID=UPI00029F6568|nr:hypothetical protein AGABI2DRAFT_115896 [Agaricus bisporus var. bisporus H97]EKV48843.1 hypothetical protein AGABI2DRAFT_115896 [Agaricus bisporus var. bisporus H97]